VIKGHLDTPAFAFEKIPRNSIDKDRRGTGCQNALDLVKPSLWKAHVFHHLEDHGVFNSVESLFEVQLKNQSFSSRLMALVYVLKTPSKTVLNAMILDKTVLVSMDETSYY
jgi:hypothetical protein